MPSRYDSQFQPPPPIRTATSSSQKSQSSGTASPEMLSPASTYAYSQGLRSPASPTEESFFGAITSRMRGRSNDRSRGGSSRKRSKSPMMLPPEHFPPTSSTEQVNPAYPAYAAQRPQQPRHVSSASQSSMASASTKANRHSIQSPQRRSTNGSDMWRGRHSNSWLFNDFSVTEHAKDFLSFGRKS